MQADALAHKKLVAHTEFWLLIAFKVLTLNTGQTGG
jgi:hypothetical protein